MTDKKLEEIKKQVVWFENHSKPKVVMLSAENFIWLVEQVERVFEQADSLRQYREENKRLVETLKTEGVCQKYWHDKVKELQKQVDFWRINYQVKESIVLKQTKEIEQLKERK